MSSWQTYHRPLAQMNKKIPSRTTGKATTSLTAVKANYTKGCSKTIYTRDYNNNCITILGTHAALQPQKFLFAPNLVKTRQTWKKWLHLCPLPFHIPPLHDNISTQNDIESTNTHGKIYTGSGTNLKKNQFWMKLNLYDIL